VANGVGGKGGVQLSGKWHYLAAGATVQPKELHCAVNQVTCATVVTDKR